MSFSASGMIEVGTEKGISASVITTDNVSPGAFEERNSDNNHHCQYVEIPTVIDSRLISFAIATEGTTEVVSSKSLGIIIIKSA